MKKIQNIIQKLSKTTKARWITILVLLIFAVTISMPTLARYKNRLDLESILNSHEVWDGTVAESYAKGNGTEENPYIISNAKELAYFGKQLKENDYKDKYFKLSNDIFINKGTFNYENNQITYIIDDKTMYVENYTNKIYDTENLDKSISTINTFEVLNNFSGYLDGDHHRIYGLYMTSIDEEQGLFKNLKGTVENLYIENAMIYGGSTTAILASTATDATIKNVYTAGNVIGTKEKEKLEKYTIDDFQDTKESEKYNNTIKLPTTNIENIKTIRLRGIYSSSEEQPLKINDIELYPGEFDLELDSIEKNELTLIADDELPSRISLTNLEYEITYETGITSGVVANANNSNLTNIINKANVYGLDKASGILGAITNTNIKNAYNTGYIYSENNASALIDTIENSDENISINKLYNNGIIVSNKTYSFVRLITNNEEVKLENTFNIKTTNSNMKTTQDLILNNVLDINETNNEEIEKITVEDLEDLDYLKDTLGYKEFIDNTVLEINEEAIWIYENKNLPILYIDDLNDPIAVLNVGTYNWESIGYELDEIYLSSETAFMITPKEIDEEINAYYYIHKDKTALTKTQLDNVKWIEYTDIVTLNEEGYYVIYAKVTDSENNTKYISSEQLILDLKAPTATIKMEDDTWNSFNEELSSVYIADETNLTVTAKDTYSEVSDIKYYISTELLTKNELNEIDTWTTYEDKITLSKKGTYVVYIKTSDSLKHSAYYNTDYIIFGGFEESLILNDDQSIKYDNVNITSKSAVTYNYIYNVSTQYKEGYTTNLITNVNLPINTKITLVNNNTNKVYKYLITEEKKNYKLNEFVEIGQTNNEKTFNDKEFINEEKKNISITFDFKNTNLTENIEFNSYIEIHDKLDKVFLSTLKSTVKNTKVYAGDKTSIIIKNESEITPIELNNDTITDIDLTTDILIDLETTEEIYHTEYNDKKLGLSIKLVNANNEIVGKNELKNITFKIGDKLYSPDNDGIVRIKLSNVVAKTHSKLTIITYATDSKLETGEYNFIITPYVAADGKYTSSYSESTVVIPATTIKEEEIDYGFKVEMDHDDKMIYKKDNKTVMNFEISETGELESPNVRISLYKKYDLSAYNQTYEIVDLQDYVIGELTEIDEKIYEVKDYNLELKLNTTTFKKTGYEIRFELYDGDNHITTIKKKFIVR